MARRAAVVVALAAALLAAGCTSAAPPAAPSAASSPSAATSGATPGPAGPATCPSEFSAVLSQAVGAVRASSTSTTGLLTCVYHAGAQPVGGCSAAKITINTAPQALTDFNRWVVEAVQNARVGDDRLGRAPVFVPGVGIAADWVPAEATFETATAQRWVAVLLTCPNGARGAFALARSLARAGLRA